MGFLSILFFRQICGIIIQGSQVTGWWMWLLEYRTSWCSRFWHVLFTETILIDPQIIRSVKSHRNNMSTKRTPTNRTQYRHDLICSDMEWMTFYCNQCRHVGNLIPKHVDPIQTYLHLKGFIRSAFAFMSLLGWWRGGNLWHSQHSRSAGRSSGSRDWGGLCAGGLLGRGIVIRVRCFVGAKNASCIMRPFGWSCACIIMYLYYISGYIRINLECLWL